MQTSIPVTITEKALNELRDIYSNKNIPKDYGVRIGIKGGGCGGVSYIIGFDKKKESDEVYRLEGLDFFFEKKHVMYLIGVELDFEETSEERGFVFNSPLNQ